VLEVFDVFNVLLEMTKYLEPWIVILREEVDVVTSKMAHP
jgi:hypothetical protein